MVHSSIYLFNRKDNKKVLKLQSQIPYHEGRSNKEEVEKIRNQVDAIWEKARAAHELSMQ